VFFEKNVEKLQFSFNLARIMGTLRENQYTFFIISGSILLGMRNFSKFYRRSKHTFYVQKLVPKIV